MMELRLVQATLFKNVLEALIDLFSKANFNFFGTGFELQALDTSGVALVALLRAKAFNHYCCDCDHSIGLDLADVAKAFRCANNDDIITIKFDDGWFDTLTFTFESPEYGEISGFVFNSVRINGVPFEIPDPESKYQAIVRMPSAKFMRICNKLSSFGDSGDRDTTVVIISVDKERVEFFTHENTVKSTFSCSQTQTADNPKEPTLIEMKENVSLAFDLTFDLRCMNSFSKASALSDQVTISLSSELPAVFEYKIAEMGYIRYYMFPAKEDEMQNEGDEMQN